MQLHKNRVLRWLIVLLATLGAACQSADLIPAAPADNRVASGQSACQKADAMWNERIVPSRHAQLPALSSPGVFDLFTLLMSAYSVKALSTEGDELVQGRRKLIHAAGVEARLRLVIKPDAVGGYSGIFRSGAQCVIGRFSLASKPTAERSTPGLALKIFIAGDQPSVNLLLMNSIDGQIGHNFFAHDFSNVLPPANSFATRLLAGSFERSAVRFGAQDPNPGRLTLEHLAGSLPDGSRIVSPVTPYRLIFKPTAPARALMQEAGAADDFRVKLAGLPVGQAVYDIYTLAGEGDPEANATILGQLVLAEPLIASQYGDEKLHFQHNMARK